VQHFLSAHLPSIGVVLRYVPSPRGPCLLWCT
jgi:hypothetical protein